MTRRLDLSRVAGGGSRTAGKVSFAFSPEDLEGLRDTDVLIEAPLPPDTRARLSREKDRLSLEFQHPDLGLQHCGLDLSGLEGHAVYECEVLWNLERVVLKLTPSPEDDDPKTRTGRAGEAS